MMQTIKNVRIPAPVSAGHNRTADKLPIYTIALSGNKVFYNDIRELIQDALAGVA